MDNVDKLKILILDPAKSIRNVLKERLEFEQFSVDAFATLEEGYRAHEENVYDILLCDGTIGDQHVALGRRDFSNLGAIIMSNNPTVRTAVNAIRDGAFDFVPKPVEMNELLAAIRTVIQLSKDNNIPTHVAAKRGNSKAKNKLDYIGDFERNRNCNCPDGDSTVDSIVGMAAPILHVKSLIDRVGPSEARVMITGPNGTGKELVARWLHEKSPRCGKPFVEVNCAAIPSELIESELFGHEKGSFTSAVKQHIGKFEQANGGTLFLDEIGDMSHSAQAKVLRALQESKILRVGGDKDVDIDVRVISATNKNLREEIAQGRFREDLFHRLTVIVIHVPPLVDRLDDIPLLVNYFVKKICMEYGIDPKPVDPDALDELRTMRWTGNIRELRNVVERLIILSGERITLNDVRTYVKDDKWGDA